MHRDQAGDPDHVRDPDHHPDRTSHDFTSHDFTSHDFTSHDCTSHDDGGAAMNHDDEDARDVRAALGDLLVDEPSAPWSAADDITRGRAYQRRRRTRVGAGIGLVAALAMVVGLVGPLRPGGAPVVPPTTSSTDAVQQRLASLGWQVREAVTTSSDSGQPMVVYTVVQLEPGTDPGSVPIVTPSPAGPDPAAITFGGIYARLAVITYPVGTPQVNGLPADSVLQTCGDGCIMTASIPDCVDDSCPSQFSALVDGLPGGYSTYAQSQAVVLAYDDGSAVEGVASAIDCPNCSLARPPKPFLTVDQLAGVLTASRSPVQPTPAPTPSGTATPADAVARVLERFGMVARSIEPVTESFGTSTTYTVDVEPGAAAPVGAVLRVTAFTDPGGAAGERVAVQGSVMNGCDERTCTPLQQVPVPCASIRCAKDWAATTGPAYTGVDAGTLVVFRSDGKRAVEAVVGVRACPTCSGGKDTSAFLSLDQTQQVLNAAFEATAPEPSSLLRACEPDDVKVIPGAGQPSEATGARGIWIEIHARNPEVDCVVTGVATVSLTDAVGELLRVRYVEGVYGSQDVGTGSVEVSQARGPARFALTKYRCDEEPSTPAAMAVVTLEGWKGVAWVELVDGFGIEHCPGGVDAPGNTVYVSGVTGPSGDDPGVENLLPEAPGVAAYLEGRGIAVTGGVDFAGKGPVGPGGDYRGQYALTKGTRAASVTVALELGRSTTSDAVACSQTCAEFRSTETGTDSGGATYAETQVVVVGDSPYGPAGARVLERVYGDLLMRLVVPPWQGTSRAILTADEATMLADAFAVDARAAVGVPAA